MKNIWSKFRLETSESGIIMVGALIIIIFFMAVSVSVYSFSIQHYVLTKRSLTAFDALNLAEAGADAFLYNINANNAYTGTGGPVTLYNDSVKGKGTYEATVASGSIAYEKIVTVTGKIYLPASASTPKLVRKVKVVIEGTPQQGYAVISGAGGLQLSNNAQIGGLVWIDGKISMSNNALIGSPTQPATVKVANYNCPSPANSTYPAACTSGQPISLINAAHIYGDVTANYQTSGTGMSSSGLVGSSGVSYLALPDYDRAAQKAAVATTITGASAGCSGNSTKTWNANTHITGNVLISNSCTVTVKGNVWIDGSFTIQNNATIKVDSSMASAPTIMVDGSAGAVFKNNSVVASNSTGWGFQFISFYSTASCSPDCANVTGTDLANSQNLITMDMENGGLGANTLFYARWSKVFVNNNGSVGGINGQTIQLTNNGNITFGYAIGGNSLITYDVRYYEPAF